MAIAFKIVERPIFLSFSAVHGIDDVAVRLLDDVEHDDRKDRRQASLLDAGVAAGLPLDGLAVSFRKESLLSEPDKDACLS